MKLLNLFLFAFLFSCKEEIKLPDNIVIARWDLKDIDSTLRSETFTFPRLVLFMNNKMFIYRSNSLKPLIDYDNKSFEFGESQETIPPKLTALIKFITTDHLDTLYTHTDGKWDYTHYGLVDLKTNKYCLYVPWNYSDTTFKAMDQFLRYAGTAKIKSSADTTALHIIRKTIDNIAQRRASNGTSPRTKAE